MRTRIALIAAVAAIVTSAVVASAFAKTGMSSTARAHAHTLERKGSLRDLSFTARDSPTVLSQVAWAVHRQVVLRNRERPALASAPAPAAPPPAPAPAPVAPPPPPPPAPVVVAPAPAPQPVVVSASATDATSTATADWACIRAHESGDNYSENTGNGYSGAYQFMPSTWNEAVSGAGYPQYANGEAYLAPPSVQDAAALWLYHQDGWAPWSTRYVCGL